MTKILEQPKGFDLETYKFPRFNKWRKNEGEKKKRVLADILSHDPHVNFAHLSRRMRITRGLLLRYFNELKSEGNPDAMKRYKDVLKRKEIAEDNRQKVLEYFQRYPYSRTASCANDTGIDFHVVRKAVQHLKQQGKDIRTARALRTDAKVDLDVAEFFRKNPNATQSQAMHEIGVSQKRVSEACKRITEEYQARAADTYGLVAQWWVDKVIESITIADTKLDGCKSPTTGARWLELRLQALKMLAQKWNLQAPDINFNVNLQVTKEDRDAVAQSVAKSIAYSEHIDLVPPAQGMIDVTPIDEPGND